MTEEKWLLYILKKRFPEKFNFCSYCNVTKTMRVNKKYKRIYYQHCNHYVNPLKGTFLNTSKITICNWIILIKILNTKTITSKTAGKILGLSTMQAWRYLNKLRSTLDFDFFQAKSAVQIDEMFLGSPKNNYRKQKYNRAEIEQIKMLRGNKRRYRSRNNTYKDKELVFGIASSNGHYLAFCSGIKVQDKKTLMKNKLLRMLWLYYWHFLIDHYVPNNIIYTDGDPAVLHMLALKKKQNYAVVHSKKRFVEIKEKQIVTTNAIEGFFGRFKRTFKGMQTHSKAHLQNYLTEAALRNSKKLTFNLLFNKSFTS